MLQLPVALALVIAPAESALIKNLTLSWKVSPGVGVKQSGQLGFARASNGCIEQTMFSRGICG